MSIFHVIIIALLIGFNISLLICHMIRQSMLDAVWDKVSQMHEDAFELCCMFIGLRGDYERVANEIEMIKEWKDNDEQTD